MIVSVTFAGFPLENWLPIKTKWLSVEMQKTLNDKNNLAENASQKVAGSNPGAGKRFFNKDIWTPSDGFRQNLRNILRETFRKGRSMNQSGKPVSC